MAKRLAVTIIVTACLGTVLLIGAEILMRTIGADPPKAVSLIFGCYTIIGVAVWRLSSKLARPRVGSAQGRTGETD